MVNARLVEILGTIGNNGNRRSNWLK